MLGPDQTRAASALLFDQWQNGRRLAALPSGLRPTTRAEGYAIQAHLEEQSAASLFSWKIAATSRAGQAHVGVDGPMAARHLVERVLRDGAAVPLGANHMRVAEVEFALHMGQDLPPRTTVYETGEVLAAVETLYPAIKIPNSRFEDFAVVSAPQLIADNACAHPFVLGPEANVDWRKMDLAEHTAFSRVFDRTELQGKGATVLDDPASP